MKFLLLILVVLAAVWLLRGARRRVEPPAEPSAPPSPASPQQIVACAQCGVHLPSGEALPGRGGVFCGEAHRAEFEKSHPPA
jgi:uncharacterized protein